MTPQIKINDANKAFSNNNSNKRIIKIDKSFQK